MIKKSDKSMEMAEAIMNGNEVINTGFGRKKIEGVRQMLLNGGLEAAEAIMNGKKYIQTGWGKKSLDGVLDMMDQVSLKVAKKKTSSDFIIEKIKNAIVYRERESDRLLKEAQDIKDAWQDQDYDYLAEMEIITQEQADQINLELEDMV